MNWKAIPKWPQYEASCDGVIRNRLTQKVIRPRLKRSGNGYLIIDLYGATTGDGRSNRVTIGVHILICSTFHGPRPSPEHEAAHGNGVRSDNYSSNLRWATRLENAEDKRLHGTAPLGDRNTSAKLTAAQVLDILADPRPQGVVAADYGVDRRTVGKIKNGQRWAHITASPAPALAA